MTAPTDAERAREIVGDPTCDCDYGANSCPHGARRRMIPIVAAALAAVRAEEQEAERSAVVAFLMTEGRADEPRSPDDPDLELDLNTVIQATWIRDGRHRPEADAIRRREG